MKVKTLGDDDSEDSVLYQRAKAAYSNQNWIEAVYFFEKMMIVNRDGSGGEAKILEKIVSCHERLKNYNQAIDWSRTLILRRPDIPNGYLRLGKNLRLMGKVEEARRIYLRGISKVDKSAICELEKQLDAIKKSLNRNTGSETTPNICNYLSLEIIRRIVKYFASHEIVALECLDLKILNLVHSSSSLWWTRLWLAAEISRLFLNNTRLNQTLSKTLYCSSLRNLEKLAQSKKIHNNCLKKLVLEGMVFHNQTYRIVDYARSVNIFKFIRCKLNIALILSLLGASSTIGAGRTIIFSQCEDPFCHPNAMFSFALTLSNLDHAPTNLLLQNWMQQLLCQSLCDALKDLQCRHYENSSFGISYNFKERMVALCDCSGDIQLASKLKFDDTRYLRHLVTKDRSFLELGLFRLRSLHLLAPLSMNDIFVWLQRVNSTGEPANLCELGLYNLSGIVDAKKLIDAITSSSIGRTLRIICIPALGNLPPASLTKLNNSYPRVRIIVGFAQAVRLLNQRWHVYKEILFG